MLTQEEFDQSFREIIKEKFAKEIAEGTVYETESGWHGLNFKG